MNKLIAFLGCAVLISLILFMFDSFQLFLPVQSQHIDYFAKHYMNLPEASKNNKVVLSLTVSDQSNVPLLDVICSLLNQTRKVDQITVNITKDKEASLPDKIRHYATVFYTHKDYGCANCIVPTILRERNENTLIIFVNSEFIYNPNLVEQMVEEANKYKEMAIKSSCGNSFIVRPSFFSTDLRICDACSLDNIEKLITAPIKQTDKCFIAQ